MLYEFNLEYGLGDAVFIIVERPVRKEFPCEICAQHLLDDIVGSNESISCPKCGGYEVYKKTVGSRWHYLREGIILGVKIKGTKLDYRIRYIISERDFFYSDEDTRIFSSREQAMSEMDRLNSLMDKDEKIVYTMKK